MAGEAVEEYFRISEAAAQDDEDEEEEEEDDDEGVEASEAEGEEEQEWTGSSGGGGSGHMSSIAHLTLKQLEALPRKSINEGGRHVTPSEQLEREKEQWRRERKAIKEERRLVGGIRAPLLIYFRSRALLS